MRLYYQQPAPTFQFAKLISLLPAIFIVLMILLGMTGCGTAQPIVVTKYVLETPPDALLQDCHAVPPPDPTLYLEKDFDGKEQMLTDTLADNYQVITVCNIHKSELRAWKKDQIEIYAAKNKQGAK